MRSPGCRRVLMQCGPSEMVGSVCLLSHRPRRDRDQVWQGDRGILEAYDLTGCACSAAQLAGRTEDGRALCGVRDAGADPLAAEPQVIDGFLPKVEELVDRRGQSRADVIHRRLPAMGQRVGTHTRRAVAAAKTAWRGGHRRSLPAVDPGAGDVAPVDGARPAVGGRQDTAVLLLVAWSRFRVVIPSGTSPWALDRVCGPSVAADRWSTGDLLTTMPRR